MEDEKIICTYCHHEVEPGQKRFYSQQAGMRGYYHWGCFVSACRQANKVGANEIETVSVGADNFDGFGLGYEIVDE